MSIIDPIQKQLCIDVWDERMRLRPEVRKQIIDGAKEVVGDGKLLGLFIIGTITGYQYTESSDVDINVSVLEVTDDMRERALEVSGRTVITGGRHPINYNLKQNSGNDEMWQDATFGIYNVLRDDWTNLPPGPDKYRDPVIEYKLEIDYARVIANEFNSRIEKFKKHVATLTKIKRFKWTIPFLGQWFYNHKNAQIRKELIELAQMAHALENDRKFAYYWGWGAPRGDFRNIVFKFLEHSPNGKFFKILQKVEIPTELSFGPTKEELKASEHPGEVVKVGEELVDPEQYHQTKQLQREATMNRSDVVTPVIGGATGLAIGAILARKAGLRGTLSKLVNFTGAGALSSGAVDQLIKRKATKELVSTDTRRKDYAKYEEIARNILINQTQ